MTSETDYNPLRTLATTDAHRILEDAATLLAATGWIRGSVRTHDGLDLLGAIAVAAGARRTHLTDDPDLLTTVVPSRHQPGALAAWHVLEAITGDPLAWNDQPTRTADEVIALLRHLAHRLSIAR